MESCAVGSSSRRSRRAGLWPSGALLASLSLLACQGDPGVSDGAQLDWNGGPPALTEGSLAPREGGACDSDGEVAPCGKVIERFDDYVTCSEGTRTCEDGRWSDCVGARTTQKPARAGAVGLRTLALGAPEQCPEGFDVCDPYCNRVVDTPDQITDDDPLTGLEDFNRGTSGITPIATGVGNCTSLSLGVSPETPLVDGKWVVTGLSPLGASPATTLKLTLTASPAGCAPSPFETTWAVDKVDRATVGGSMSDTGTLTLAVPIAGTLRVTAFGKGLVSPALEIPVGVNVLQTAGLAPNTAAAAADVTAFGTASSTPSTVTWLYPYEGTHFPLGLPAPVLQYRYSTACGNGRSVKVSLRYPTGASATNAQFNYSMVIKEANTASAQAGYGSNIVDPQAVIPQAAWQYFEQTARGSDAELIVQRLRSRYVNNYGNCTSEVRVEPEERLGIHFVDGQLKGTVFYNSYTSPLGGNVGAVLKISPGATEPQIAVQQRHGSERRCTVCHTLSVDGSKLIANVDLRSMISGGVQFNNTRRYNMTAANPSASVLNTWTMQGSSEFPDDGDDRGDRFTYGAPWLNGDFYMTYGGEPSYEGEHNWRSPYDWSKFYRLGSGATNPSDNAITVAGWGNVSAVTPRFSPDGSKLAFGFWGRQSSSYWNPASRLPCSNPSTSPCSGNELTADRDGTRLAVVDFVAPSNTAGNNGWKVENARDVTPGVTHKVAWPTFTPDGQAVAYQRVFRGSNDIITVWSPSALNTVTGALGEIWLSNVPANGNSTATPTRLLALNGLSSSCSATSTSCTSSYLPTASRTFAATGWPVPPNYHSNASFTVHIPDSCSTASGARGTASGVNDHQLNYLPSFNPTEAGGKRWVIFSSRRMYGNIAHGHPWDAEPGMSCEASKDTPSTKKLWVSAIDKEWTPGQDPSHPAFYLPGQELKAGNSNAYWVNAACTPEGATCTTNDDCCGGTGDSPTTRCKVVSSSPLTKECTALSACSAEGEECASTSQCCTGLTCPEGGGTCLNIPEPIFETQTLAREYVTECPHGTVVKWRFFEWQASLPAGTSLDFSVQTKEEALDDYLPLVPLTVASATVSTAAGAWDRGAQTTEQALVAAGLASRSHLLVTMTFNPDPLGSAAPTLNGWRQIYDCVPEQ